MSHATSIHGVTRVRVGKLAILPKGTIVRTIYIDTQDLGKIEINLFGNHQIQQEENSSND